MQYVHLHFSLDSWSIIFNSAEKLVIVGEAVGADCTWIYIRTCTHSYIHVFVQCVKSALSHGNPTERLVQSDLRQEETFKIFVLRAICMLTVECINKVAVTFFKKFMLLPSPKIVQGENGDFITHLATLLFMAKVDNYLALLFFNFNSFFSLIHWRM
jgi:hypothetical protein